MTQEKLTWIKRIGALALLTISLIMIIVTFVAGANSGIVGRWDGGYGSYVEFRGDGTATLVGFGNAELMTIDYQVHGNQLVFDASGAQVTCTFQVQGNQLLMSSPSGASVQYALSRISGGGFMWGLLVAALLLAGGAFVLYFSPVLAIIVGKKDNGEAPTAAHIPAEPACVAAPVSEPVRPVEPVRVAPIPRPEPMPERRAPESGIVSTFGEKPAETPSEEKPRIINTFKTPDDL